MDLKISDLDIVVADPSHTVQHVLTNLVAAAGVRSIRCVDSVRAAMTEMLRQPPDVLLGAFHFGDGTGADLVEAMRDDVRTRDVAFLCVTSEEDDHLFDRIRQAGLVALLRKPIDSATLATALHSTVGQLVHVEGVFEFEELKVLVVDDSRTSRRHIGNVLEKLGINDLTFAEDGVEATQILARSGFDLVVTDYNMPKMDGDDLIQHIRGESNQPTVPILMVTSESDAARLAAVHRHGVSALCDKPFAIDQVRALISTII